MSDDPNGRHLANLEEMKAAFEAKMQEWKNEDVAREQMRAEWRASFEAGLAHFAEVTGLHDEIAPLVRDVRGEEKVVQPPEPVYTGLAQEGLGAIRPSHVNEPNAYNDLDQTRV